MSGVNVIAAVLGGVRAITFSGSLDATGVAGVATSTTRTVTVPPGNSGVINFNTYVDAGTITNTQYSRNGGAFTTIADGIDTAAFTDGDTIAVRTNGNGVGEQRVMTLTDKTTSRTITTVYHTGA